jgi:hypothetical protein
LWAAAPMQALPSAPSTIATPTEGPTTIATPTDGAPPISALVGAPLAFRPVQRRGTVGPSCMNGRCLDPDELAKAAPTFNNIPVLIVSGLLPPHCAETFRA